MRSSSEVYHEVAQRCSAYDKKDRNGSLSNAAGSEKSCLNCKHFAEEEYCKLDLYDPIVKNL
ncbi:MAG: hypothetical protein E7258_06695 [Lachnospiraceae bacterium]|nr:hypothetical protein [Lachnospiraceae bacterium]